MDEFLGSSNLEQYRDPHYKQLHWIADPIISKQIIADYTSQNKPFGLEVGFGIAPTRVHLIDPSINWILTEPNQDSYALAKRDIDIFWEGVAPEDIPPALKMFALNAHTNSKILQKPKSLVYRNLDYRNMGDLVPNINDLQAGQRLTFIVSHTHISEIQLYYNFLSGLGYNPRNLQLRDPSLPPLSRPLKDMPEEYVLDITKAE